MNDEIEVKVIRYPDRANLVLAYVDPVSGKRKTKSAETSVEKDAWKAAAKWEEELRTGRYQAGNKITWQEFRQRYEAEKVPSLAPGSQEVTAASLDCLERILNPSRLNSLTPRVLSEFQARLRKDGLREATIAKHLRQVKTALNWAAKTGLLARVPAVEMPKRAKASKLMKGRPITTEEFERMLAAVPEVRPSDAPEWVRYLNGLWLSGLRLAESMALSWDLDAPFSVDLSGKYPRFRILGEAQKSGRDELLPMTPDFAEWLLQTPERDRMGPVFRLPTRTGTRWFPGHVVGRIGKKAAVVVNKAEGKYASAHDLRRAFGTRWARKVMPAVLQKLMRHASIQTTMAYYVDLDTDELAAELWANRRQSGAGNKTGNIPAKKRSGPGRKNERNCHVD